MDLHRPSLQPPHGGRTVGATRATVCKSAGSCGERPWRGRLSACPSPCKKEGRYVVDGAKKEGGIRTISRKKEKTRWKCVLVEPRLSARTAANAARAEAEAQAAALPRFTIKMTAYMKPGRTIYESRRPIPDVPQRLHNLSAQPGRFTSLRCIVAT
jgi:hypothetical protein